MTATPGSTTGVAPAQEGAAPAPPPAVNLPTFVIRPHRGLVALDLGELWAYRELLWTLVWRELKVRYKQTAIGAAWAVVQPAFSMVLFAIVFGKLAQLPSDGAPYPLFSYAALVPWQFFSRALTEASMSLIAQDRLVTKVYFPRMMVPSAVVLSGVADLAIALLLALALMLYYGHPPGPAFAAIPLFVLLAVIAACGISLWLSALNVSYRDVRYVLPFLTQLWLYATPVVYPMSLIPQKWRLWAGLNPMCGVVDGFRWCILGTRAPDLGVLAVSSAVSVVLLVSGAAYFRHVERTMADRI
ncbi:MAG TPA: ABC transporter permease [Polyangia bacterium]|nr:ABC transporter permease [Polyangia bacterium]